GFVANVTVTSARNSCISVSPSSAPDGFLFMNVLCANSGRGLEAFFDGAIAFQAPVSTTVSNIVAADDPVTGLYSFGGVDVNYRGRVALPASNPCQIVVAPSSGIDSDCNLVAPSTGTRFTAGSSQNSFVAVYASAIDSVNMQGTSSELLPLDAIIDPFLFENSSRLVGVPGVGDGSAAGTLETPTPASETRVGILDLSLATGDTLALGVNPSPTTSVMHSFTGRQIEALDHAIERIGDAMGDDDGLCESGEGCIYTPNIGAYQGHGNLVPIGVVSADAVSNVELWEYELNGR
ncbi:MAG: hypothetical protein AAFQ99_13720, partial [Pseudomonadota bacterium]